MIVFLFARPAELLGASAVTVPTCPTVRDLRHALAEQHPILAPILPTCRVAVNHEFADDDTRIPESAELALIPPVSGG